MQIAALILSVLCLLPLSVGQVPESECTLTPPNKGNPTFRLRLKKYQMALNSKEHTIIESGTLGSDNVGVRITTNACIHFGRRYDLEFPIPKQDLLQDIFWVTRTREILRQLDVNDLAAFLARKIKTGETPQAHEQTNTEIEQVVEFKIVRKGDKTRVTFSVYSTP